MKSLSVNRIIMAVTTNKGVTYYLWANRGQLPNTIQVAVNQEPDFSTPPPFHFDDDSKALRTFLEEQFEEKLDTQDWGAIIGRLVHLVTTV
jgi:hypothetical protein